MESTKCPSALGQSNEAMLPKEQENNQYSTIFQFFSNLIKKKKLFPEIYIKTIREWIFTRKSEQSDQGKVRSRVQSSVVFHPDLDSMVL